MANVETDKDPVIVKAMSWFSDNEIDVDRMISCGVLTRRLIIKTYEDESFRYGQCDLNVIKHSGLITEKQIIEMSKLT